MRVTIEIDCDNAAFDPCPGFEIARILRAAALLTEDLDAGANDRRVLKDVCGNTVGHLEVTA